MTPLHPTVAEIHLDSFRQNLQRVRSRIGPHRALLPVIKADAYGHGMIPIARAALDENVEGFGVAFVEEGVQLRQAGIKPMILVMAGFLPEEAGAIIEHGLTPVVSHPTQLESLRPLIKQLSRPLRIHIKVDTGMGRLGLSETEALPFIREASAIQGIEIQGLMSHFSDDDMTDSKRAQEQLRCFERTRKEIETLGIKIPTLHMANSAAIMGLDKSWLNMVRPGIMLYGYPPSPHADENASFKQVLTLKTRIIHLKEVRAGTSLSYGHTFTTSRPSRIAVLPIGYADGYSRAWSNRGQVLIGGRRVPVVGRVCMDMTLADVTAVPSALIGDEVILIGRQASESLWANELADQLKTNPYEILCAIGQRVHRLYGEGGLSP